MTLLTNRISFWVQNLITYRSWLYVNVKSVTKSVLRFYFFFDTFQKVENVLLMARILYDQQPENTICTVCYVYYLGFQQSSLKFTKFSMCSLRYNRWSKSSPAHRIFPRSIRISIVTPWWFSRLSVKVTRCISHTHSVAKPLNYHHISRWLLFWSVNF